MASSSGEIEIQSDILETIFSFVPLVHLISAALVSRTWRDAVHTTLRYRNKPKPWLILHSQSTRNHISTTKSAYDPRSNIWIKITQPPIEHSSAAIGSNYSNFVYMLCPSKFSFSIDPLNFDWCHIDPPKVWRTDPIVAMVKDYVVIAGGACDFEDDPLAVEIYSLRLKTWEICKSMPENLKNSAASTWLSIATTSEKEKLIVTERETGVTHWFDPATRTWSDPIVLSLNPGQVVSNYNIGFCDNSLILVGLLGMECLERVKVWRVSGEEFECEEIGEMPYEYVEKLRSESFGISSVNIRAAGNVFYVYSSWMMEEVVACEFVDGGGLAWWSVRNVVARADSTKRVVLTCSEVGFKELQEVMRAGNARFDVS